MKKTGGPKSRWTIPLNIVQTMIHFHFEYLKKNCPLEVQKTVSGTLLNHRYFKVNWSRLFLNFEINVKKTHTLHIKINEKRIRNRFCPTLTFFSILKIQNNAYLNF